MSKPTPPRIAALAQRVRDAWSNPKAPWRALALTDDRRDHDPRNHTGCKVRRP